MNDLLRECSAIVLSGGSTVPRDLNVKGRELKGIYYAMQFLKQQNKLVSGSDPHANKAIESNILEELVSAKGKNVIVIGGGDTGSDCVGTSNRQGAASITQFELLPKPPEKRNETMPWPTYPMVLKTSTSHEEGCDRKWAIATKEFIGDKDGNLIGIKTVELDWKIEQGRPANFIERAGSEKILESLQISDRFPNGEVEDFPLHNKGTLSFKMSSSLGKRLNHRDNSNIANKRLKSSARTT